MHKGNVINIKLINEFHDSLNGFRKGVANPNRPTILKGMQSKLVKLRNNGGLIKIVI